MNCYEIWADLAPGVNDLELVEAAERYLQAFVDQGLAESFRIRRRKFGFGPSGLPEFNFSVEFVDLAQMDRCFLAAARRSGDLESLHTAVYSRVVNFTSGLYRDFPDEVRER